MDLGYEQVKIPVRVRFEFEVSAGAMVPGTLAYDRLFNPKALQSRYPEVQSEILESAIDATVKEGICRYLKKNGYLEPDAAPPFAAQTPIGDEPRS